MKQQIMLNLKYKTLFFLCFFTPLLALFLFYLSEHTYMHACIHAMYVCVCLCVSVLYIVSIYRYVCIYQLCSLNLSSCRYVYISYVVSRQVCMYQCSIQSQFTIKYICISAPYSFIIPSCTYISALYSLNLLPCRYVSALYIDSK